MAVTSSTRILLKTPDGKSSFRYNIFCMYSCISLSIYNKSVLIVSITSNFKKMMSNFVFNHDVVKYYLDNNI